MEEGYYLIMPFGSKGQPGPEIRDAGGSGGSRVCGVVVIGGPMGNQVLMLR